METQRLNAHENLKSGNFVYTHGTRSGHVYVQGLGNGECLLALRVQGDLHFSVWANGNVNSVYHDDEELSDEITILMKGR